MDPYGGLHVFSSNPACIQLFFPFPGSPLATIIFQGLGQGAMLQGPTVLISRLDGNGPVVFVGLTKQDCAQVDRRLERQEVGIGLDLGMIWL